VFNLIKAMCANHEGLIDAIETFDECKPATRSNSKTADSNHIRAIKAARSGDYTYGHYTLGSVKKVVSAMMNPVELLEGATYLDATHSLTSSSLFLDIGSGFGYPNFVATAIVGCDGLGIEISDNRVKSCQRVLDFMEQSREYNHIDWKHLI
jgi:hypothetical protein